MPLWKLTEEAALLVKANVPLQDWWFLFFLPYGLLTDYSTDIEYVIEANTGLIVTVPERHTI
jgi:hypothetical protein